MYASTDELRERYQAAAAAFAEQQLLLSPDVKEIAARSAALEIDLG